MVKLKWPQNKQELLETEKAEEKKVVVLRDTKHHQPGLISSIPL